MMLFRNESELQLYFKPTIIKPVTYTTTNLCVSEDGACSRKDLQNDISSLHCITKKVVVNYRTVLRLGIFLILTLSPSRKLVSRVYRLFLAHNSTVGAFPPSMNVTMAKLKLQFSTFSSDYIVKFLIYQGAKLNPTQQVFILLPILETH